MWLNICLFNNCKLGPRNIPVSNHLYFSLGHRVPDCPKIKPGDKLLAQLSPAHEAPSDLSLFIQ